MDREEPLQGRISEAAEARPAPDYPVGNRPHRVHTRCDAAPLPGHRPRRARAGLRQGEVFGLSPDDIDCLRKIIHVRRQVKIVGCRTGCARRSTGRSATPRMAPILPQGVNQGCDLRGYHFAQI